MTPKMLTSSALSLIVAVGATSLTAQQSSDSATVTDDDSAIMEQIEAADAPDTAETDPVNETEDSQMAGSGTMDQSDTQGSDMATSDMLNQSDSDMAGSGMMNQSGSQMAGQTRQRSQGGGAIMDLQTISQDIYERGYRQGYIRGVQEARQDFAMQMQYLAKRGQLMQNYQDWRSRQSGGSSDQSSMNSNGMSGGMMNNSSGQMMDGQSTQSSQNRSQRQNQSQSAMNNSQMGSNDSGSTDMNRISNMVMARPGGSIVILPAGVSPERFIENLVNSRENAINSMNSGNMSDSDS